jgi:heme A synthase
MSRHRALRAAALSAVAATVLLIAVGALVRATGSGEGCPGWPRCFGRWVPPFSYHPGVSRTNALIEYSHRLTASLVFLTVAWLAVIALSRYRPVRRVSVPAALSVGLWLFQAVLGGLVVRFGLTPSLVTAHLAVANVFLGTLAYTAVAAFSVEVTPSGRMDSLTRLAWSAAGSVLALIVVGALVRGEGAGLAFRDWPLMNGRVVPSLGALRPALMFTHRVLAAAVAVVVGVLALWAWRRRRTRGPFLALAGSAAGLYVAQVLIGAANVWTRLAVGPVVAHVAVSSLIWASLVAAAAASRACWTAHEARSPHGGATRSEAAQLDGLVKAPEPAER